MFYCLLSVSFLILQCNFYDALRSTVQMPHDDDNDDDQNKFSNHSCYKRLLRFFKYRCVDINVFNFVFKLL